MKRDGFSSKVRQAAAQIQERLGKVPAYDLRRALDLISRKDAEKMYDAIRDLIRHGDLKRIERGVYEYVEKEKTSLQKQEVMWRFLRMEKNVSAEDLVVACDVSREYADQFLMNLVDLGIVRKDGLRYQLLKDQLETPVNDAKAKKLRDIRAKQKASLALGLKRATIVIAQAIRFLEDECD